MTIAVETIAVETIAVETAQNGDAASDTAVAPVGAPSSPLACPGRARLPATSSP